MRAAPSEILISAAGVGRERLLGCTAQGLSTLFTRRIKDNTGTYLDIHGSSYTCYQHRRVSVESERCPEVLALSAYAYDQHPLLVLAGSAPAQPSGALWLLCSSVRWVICGERDAPK
jgi:hypothetical protein